MNKFVLPLIFLLLINFSLFAQSYQGPAEGSVPNGAIVSTDDFSRTSVIPDPKERVIRNTVEYDNDEPIFINFPPDQQPIPTIYVEDKPVDSNKRGGGEQVVVLKSFPGIPQTNSIPPDPYVAVGPTHVIATVNSRFMIWDKEGNIIKNIDADQWYSNVHQSPNAFDPKVSYDHFSKRWVMVWLNQNNSTQTSYFFVSVSDDSIPTGTWYNWALPSHVNGMTNVGNWGDYQGVGFDQDAIYITSNQFSFGGSFQYAKLRIVPKAQLYTNTAGSVTWQDIWNISYPPGVGGTVFNIRPAIIYGNSNEYYLMHSPASANFMSLYKLNNVLSTPVLTGVNVPVTPFANAPNANQLGGSSILIEAAGSRLRNEPTFRNGHIWATHSIANPSSPANSSVRYVKMNVTTNTTVEDFSLGAPGFWHYYTALAVDKDENVAITYSRSGDTEYIGAYYTYKKVSDASLAPSQVMQTGKGNYVKDFGSGRNRWGDYMGMWLDPADENNFWMFTEYAAATNTWGTWNMAIRLVPFPGAHIFTPNSVIDFGNVEVNFESETLDALISNYGENDLVITNIPSTFGQFDLVSNHTFPITLNPYDSLVISFKFSPDAPGFYDETYPVTSNANNFTGFTFKGKGYVINPASERVLYAVTGPQQNGDVITINTLTGAGSLVGPSLFNDVTALSVNPLTKVLYGGISGLNSSKIVRVNSELGDAYDLFNINVPNLASLAFDTSGTLYAALRTGSIYTVDLTDGSIDSVTTAAASISGIAFHPETNELWASAYVIVGGNRDRIFKINLSNGDTTVVGKTGFNLINNAIVFDETGNLYAATGTANQDNNLIEIDTETGAGTLIGPTGFKNINGFAYATGGVVSVGGDTHASLPSDFNLSQNYPNPFNPATSIEFALPVNADVKLTIYNILGQAVNVLVNKNLSAGYHKVNWNSNNSSGVKLSSGIYFYEIKAEGVNGNEFSQMKKMILMK